MALTDQDKALFDDMDRLFNSGGWDRLVTSWKEERDQLKESVFFSAKTEQDINMARLRYSLLTELIQLRDTVEGQKLAKESQEDQDG